MAPEKGEATTSTRFIPNLEPFKRTLLTADFYEDIKDDQGKKKDLADVPDHFVDEEHYLKVMEPLFWEEAFQELSRAKELEMPRDSELVKIQSFRIDHPFVKVTFNRDKSVSTTRLYSQNDLVLVSQNPDPSVKVEVHFLGLVDQSYSGSMSISCLPVASEESPRIKAVSKAIAARADWHVAKVCSTQTLVREYEGLMALPHIFLKDIIVNREDESGSKDNSTEMQAPVAMKDAELPPAQDRDSFTIPACVESALRGMYNDSQLQAIMDSRKISGITLVQGPPGTGKTKTILGIITVLLNSRARQNLAVSYSRTGQKRQHEEVGHDGASDEEEQEDPQEKRRRMDDIERRGRERMMRLRVRLPWLRDGFTPWTAETNDEVLGPGSPELIVPYPKLRKQEVVPMSELAQSVAPKKLLICTPSNAAVDEVLRRVGKEGIMDHTATPVQRDVTRLGPNLHSSLMKYSLEDIVRRRLAARSDNPDLNQQEVLKEKVMRNAAILFTTLSISGSRDMVGFPGDFDTVVMDEASQGLEVSTLVPLKLGCRRLILVGDPLQLPATCFSHVAKEHKYERSLFQRLQESKVKVNMLQVQYRMHPAISSFPSAHFYEGKVLDALDTTQFEEKFPAPWWQYPCFGPVAFFALKGSQEKAKASFVNDDEANFIIQLYRLLSELYPDENWRERMAVISPYQEQVQLIRRKFRALYSLPPKSPCPLEVNTVDGFQGREKDCIIVSVVRADTTAKSIGFVRDKRRMNVAFTRARQSLWVVGHTEVLSKNADWRQFIRQQQKKSRLFRVGQPFQTWTKRYLKDWLDRHPDEERPAGDILDTGEDASLNDQTSGDGGFTISQEELEELERRELEEAAYNAPDVEEVSDDEPSPSSDGSDGAGSDVDAAGGAADVAEEVGHRIAPGAAEDLDDDGGGDGGE